MRHVNRVQCFWPAMSGQPNRFRGRLARLVRPVALHGRDLGGLVLQRVQAMLVARKICTGAVISSIHIAIENIVLTRGLSRYFSRCQAPVAPTNSAVARRPPGPYAPAGKETTG